VVRPRDRDRAAVAATWGAATVPAEPIRCLIAAVPLLSPPARRRQHQRRRSASQSACPGCYCTLSRRPESPSRRLRQSSPPAITLRAASLAAAAALAPSVASLTRRALARTVFLHSYRFRSCPGGDSNERGRPASTVQSVSNAVHPLWRTYDQKVAHVFRAEDDDREPRSPLIVP